MNIEKRTDGINRMYVAEHTVSGTTTELLDIQESIKHTNISKCYYKPTSDKPVTFLKINPNKGKIDNAMVKSHKEFEQIVEQIFIDIGADISKFNYRRADLSINTDESGDYYLYKKLYKLIICCLSIDNGIIDNAYECNQLWSCKSLNIAIKNSMIEAENYNKEIESHGAVPTTNRLELRTKQISDNSTLEEEFAKKWCKRLESARTRYADVMKTYNDNLERLYKEDLAKPKKDRSYLSLNAFLMQYSSCIFCTAQMKDLVSRFDEVNNPESKAKNFKRYHKIEYISKTDLNVVIRALKKKIKEYYR